MTVGDPETRSTATAGQHDVRIITYSTRKEIHMTALPQLWLPILLSSVVVFIVSSFIHMALPWHKKEYSKIPDEDKVMDALRPFNVPPGDYMVPRASDAQEMRTAGFMEKMKKGPVMILTVIPNGPPSMGSSLVLWFLYSVVIGIFAAYLAGRTLPSDAGYLQVFRITGVTAFLGYSAALWQMSIWYRRSWSTTMRATIDGLVYALLTAALFGWMWPR